MSLRSGVHDFKHFHISFPGDKILLLTINRPQKLNCIDQLTSHAIAKVWEQFDEDESIWVGIITGTGRAFCTGADLQEWGKMNETGEVNSMAAPGLAGLPRRRGKKPIIAAVNGICMGGGFEMIANCDLVIAASTAIFALPEVKRGIVPVAGCLPRLCRILGLQRTMDLALTGRNVSAQSLFDWGLVSRLVEKSSDVVGAAVDLAQDMCKNSPDALIISRLGIRMSWEAGSVEDTVSSLADEWYPRLIKGANFVEGIQAFLEKRTPVYTNSKL